MKKSFLFILAFLFILFSNFAFSQKQQNTKTDDDLKSQVIENKIQIKSLDENQKKDIQQLKETFQIKNENLIYQKEQLSLWLTILSIVLVILAIGIPYLINKHENKIIKDIQKQIVELERKLEEIFTFRENVEKTLNLIKSIKKESKDLKNMMKRAAAPEKLINVEKNGIKEQLPEIKKKVDISPLDKELNEALELYLSEKYNDAIEKYKYIINTYKKNITIVLLDSIYFNLANSYNEIKEYKLSIHYYDMVIDFNPKDADTWNNKGNAFSKLQNYDEAIKCYVEAIKLDPKSANVWYNIGSAYDDLRNYDEAIKCYDEAIKLDPKDSKAWYNKGSAYDDLKNYDKAIKCYDEAIKLDPNFSKAWSNKGFIYDNLKNHKEAIKCYDEAIKLDPKYAPAWNNRGYAFSNLQNYDEAIKCYTEAIRLKEDYLSPYANLIELFIINNRIDESISYINKVKELNLKKVFDFQFIEIVYLKLIGEWQKNTDETIDELKTIAKNESPNFTYSFDEIKNWLNSDKSNYLNKENREFILSIIKEIENWKEKGK